MTFVARGWGMHVKICSYRGHSRIVALHEFGLGVALAGQPGTPVATSGSSQLADPGRPSSVSINKPSHRGG